mmetsp:Transcript_24664/g.38103  ORF Transcript_24664/g.38103 Transcript_24664/m.38103 type:complete len:281 (+) Transcript_24664:195-1037(+)
MSTNLFSVLEGALSSLARLVLFLSVISLILSYAHTNEDDEETKEKENDGSKNSEGDLPHIDTRDNTNTMDADVDENDTPANGGEVVASPLHRQNMVLAANPHVDYVLFDTTSTSGKCENKAQNCYVGITFHDKRMRVTFRVLRNRAPTDPYCVFKMHDILEAHLSASKKAIVHGQLRREYGIDPSGTFAMYSPIHVSSIQEDEAAEAMRALGFLEPDTSTVIGMPPTSAAANDQAIRTKQPTYRSVDDERYRESSNGLGIRQYHERSNARKSRKKSRRKR